MEYIVSSKHHNAIQETIDIASAAGGGKVVIPPGIHEAATIFLKSNIHLYIAPGAVLQGVTDHNLYSEFRHPEFDMVTPEFSRKCFIGAADCENITISGGGTIDGRGEFFFDPETPAHLSFPKPPWQRPRMIQLFNCRNVLIEGVSFKNSPNWTMWLANCEDVYISRIHVTTNPRVPNGDGIDIDSCRRVTVSDSIFNTSDDCLILRAIRRNPDVPAVCEHVTVNNCILNSFCQGIRLGCPSDDTIRHCSFSNIIFKGGGSGIHCESPYRYLRKNCSGYMHISDLSFNNFDIESGRYPVRIGCEGAIALRGVERLSFNNFRIKAAKPLYLEGNPNTVFRDISFTNISGVVESDSPIHVRYVDNLKLDNFSLSAVTGEVPVTGEMPDFPSWETKF